MRRTGVVLKLVVLALLVALGVVISPILRVEGMCPMAHLINVTCAVFLGPFYAFLCALIIGILRMIFMGIPPLALTGAVFGAFLSGMLYRLSKGKIVWAFLGEVIGTGIIGAVISYPVMTWIWPVRRWPSLPKRPPSLPPPKSTTSAMILSSSLPPPMPEPDPEALCVPFPFCLSALLYCFAAPVPIPNGPADPDDGRFPVEDCWNPDEGRWLPEKEFVFAEDVPAFPNGNSGLSAPGCGRCPAGLSVPCEGRCPKGYPCCCWEKEPLWNGLFCCSFLSA